MDTTLTLGAAARQLGVSKGTISKAIATGKLSATRREDGSWAIDGSELARYLEVNGHRFRSETVPSEQAATEAELRARADLAEQRLADLRSMYEDMKAQRDKWETVAQRLSLPAPKPVKTPETSPQQPAESESRFRRTWRLAALDGVTPWQTIVVRQRCYQPLRASVGGTPHKRVVRLDLNWATAGTNFMLSSEFGIGYSSARSSTEDAQGHSSAAC